MEYNNNDCYQSIHAQPGKSYISSSFIKNKGGIIQGVNDEWVEGYSFQQTNNTPPIPIYVRLMPSSVDPNKNVFWINGYQQPRLFLIEGKTYSFNINTYDEEFYISDNQARPVSVQPTNYAKYSLTIPCSGKNTTRKYNYRSLNNENIGGEIIILPKKEMM